PRPLALAEGRTRLRRGRGGGVGAPPGRRACTGAPRGCTNDCARHVRWLWPTAAPGFDAGEEAGLGPRRGEGHALVHPGGAPVTGPVLERLLAVQDRDTAADRLRHRRETLPERAELAALTERAGDLRARLTDAEARLAVVAGRQAELEEELAATEGRI